MSQESLLKENFQLMGKYNHWMNDKLFDAAEKLSVEQLDKDVGAFFGSILGTLNHILVGDIIWLKRFAEHPVHFKSLEPLRSMSQPESLSSRLYPDIESLHQARLQLDAVIIEFSKELNEAVLASDLDFKDMQGVDYQHEFGQLIQHFFNHQTHHRGQVSTLLSQFNIDIGVTDLLICIRES